MHILKQVLNKMRSDMETFDPVHIAGILLLYEEKMQFIGDSCKRFDKLEHLSKFFNGARITINFLRKENATFFDAFLRNHPCLEKVALVDMDQVDFEEYDLVFCVSYNELFLLDHLSRRYGRSILSGDLRIPVYSISDLMLMPRAESNFVFPVNAGLIQYLRSELVGVLYIGDDERTWADGWLGEMGLREGEHLYIVLDNSSTREKLLEVATFFEVLTGLLDRPGSRILIFDEKNIGKDRFYKEWLGDEYFDRMIFSKTMSLRQSLSLMASGFTSLIFGPCTGLIHCASGIYNRYVRDGAQEVPLIITYTGKYTVENKNANFWWGSSPLVKCLLLKNTGGMKKMMTVRDLPDKEKDLTDALPCSEYSAKMLLEFIDDNLTYAE